MQLIRRDDPTLTRFDSWFGDTWNDIHPLTQFLEGLGTRAPAAWRPTVEFYEDEENYHAQFEVPGVKKDEIDIELENAVLTISAKREEQGDEGRQSRFAFTRSVNVPDGIDADKVKAHLEDGILTVTMPKQEGRKPRAIQVN